MALITRTSFSTGDVPSTAEWNTQFDTAYNLLNGSIDNANVKVSAAIDATKIGDGDVSNLEFSILNGSLKNATWAPTYGASGSMSWSTITTHIARWSQIDKTVFFNIYATGTTGGSTHDYLTFTLPINALSVGNGFGGAYFTSGASYDQASAYNTSVSVVSVSTAGNWGIGAGVGFSITGFYEVA